MANNGPMWIVFLFLLWWCFILSVISLIGGWRSLAKKYPLPSGILLSGAEYHWRSTDLNWASYGHCVNFTISNQGFVMQPAFPFRFMHPAIFIPWKDIESIQGKGSLFKRYRLRVDHCRITLYGKVGEAILEAYKLNKQLET